MAINKMIQEKTNQWSREAELNFCRHGQNGGKFERQQWANGNLMVCPENGRANQAVLFNRAVELFRADWKIVA